MKTYTYDSANRLIQVSDQSVVTSLSYNGLGQRLSMDAAGVIAHYVMDGDQPLTANSAGNTTFYLYGLGAIGEKTNAWSYSLPDGTNTSRQLTNLTGDITLLARYTPWGDTLDTYGTGNFTFGYFGGVMDATTGLLYIGNGQYYDPETGRFLTRDAKPNNSNPYVPWDPTGAIIGPLGVAALFLSKRKKGSKWGTWFVLLLVVGAVGMTLAACGPQPTPGPVPQPTAVPSNNNPPTNPSPNPSQTPEPAPTQTSTPTAPPSPTNTPLPECPPPTYYPCTDSGTNICVKPTMSDVEQIAHVIHGEGSAAGGEVGANVMQAVINRAYIYWEFTHHRNINPNNIPWNQMTRKQLSDLLLFVLSEDDGGGSSAYDAWDSPYPHSGVNWQMTIEAIDRMLNDAGADPKVIKIIFGIAKPADSIRFNENVHWYASSKSYEPPNGSNHKDVIRRYGKYCYAQYYMTYPWHPPKEVLDCP